MEKELLIAQWLLDNNAFLLLEYETSFQKEMSIDLYLKAMAHQHLIGTMNAEEFEVAFDSTNVQKIIDFWFKRESDTPMH